MATNTKTKTKKTDPTDLIFLAAILYFSQFIENIFHDLIQWTPLIDVVPLGNTWWTLILRVLCVAAWIGVLYLIVKSSRKCGYDPIERVSGVKMLEWAAPLAVAVLFVAYFILSDGGLSVLWAKLTNMGGVVGTISYPIFLAAQVAIMVTVIALSQKGFELLLPKASKYIPFGGIFLGVCMTVVNLISGLSSGSVDVLVILFILLIQTIYGVVYTLAGRRAILAFPFIYVMFFIL